MLRLRNRIFTAINGEEGIAIPGKLVDASRLKQVYSHPAAEGRSRGAALSDLFWYWLAPGPHVHQEHLEAGARYEEVARTTRRALAMSRREAEELAAECMARVLDRADIRSSAMLCLRDLMMPVWAEFYYELVFRESLPAGRARPHCRQCPDAGDCAEVLQPAAHGTTGPAHPVPARQDPGGRGADRTTQATFHRGAGVLSPGHILQHGCGADVGGNGASIHGHRAASRGASNACRQPAR